MINKEENKKLKVLFIPDLPTYSENVHQYIEKSIELNRLNDIVELVKYPSTTDDMGIGIHKFLNFVFEEGIDIVIGYGIGAWYARQANVPRILVNPILDWSDIKHLLSHEIDEDTNKYLYELYKEHKTNQVEWQFYASNDELIGRKVYTIERREPTNKLIYPLNNTHQIDAHDAIEIIHIGLKRLLVCVFGIDLGQNLFDCPPY